MPTNLTAEAQAKLARYQQARTLEEKIKALEEALPLIPDHKGTERMRAQLKATLAKLRREAERRKIVKVGRHDDFMVRREGAAQVVLLGTANSGKSTLLSTLTNARPAIGAYSLTTVKPAPGMMRYEDVEIQLVELPAILTGDLKETPFTARSIAVARNADLIMLMLDCGGDPVAQLEHVMSLLDESGVVLKEKRSTISVEKKDSGDVRLVIFGNFRGTLSGVKELLRSIGIRHAVVKVYGDASIADLEEQVLRETVYKKAVLVAGRADLAGPGMLDKLAERVAELGVPLIAVSDKNIGSIRETIYRSLGVIRIYTQKDGVVARNPIVIHRDATIQDLAKVIHKDFARNLRYAKVWGRSVRIQGQQVGPGHRLDDGDVVELFL
ncbi:MAG: TGS domain-containing protein [Nitrososphaerota archaeon]